MSGVWRLTSDVWRLTSDVWRLASGVWRLVSGAQLSTVSEVATELRLSVKTVSTYRARILEKLQLRNSAELIHYAVVHGIVG